LFSSRSRHTIFSRDWSSDVCSSDLDHLLDEGAVHLVDQASRLKARTDLVEGAARLLGRGQSELDAADLGLVLDLAGYQLDGHLEIGRASCRERVQVEVGSGTIKGEV